MRSFQYVLNSAYYAGRLTLEGEALARYVRSLINDWKDAAAHVHQPVAWAVDLGESDITHLMRNLIAARVYDAWRSDVDLGDRARFDRWSRLRRAGWPSAHASGD